MTLKQAARELRMKENTIKNQYNRTVENLKKKGVILTRWKTDVRGVYEYEIEYEEYEDDE